ncbi:hypothetical protein IJ425_00775 [bacterium]|nr:hypothetical protein [bacterium]
MSINAINSVSLYEYYYKINKDEQEKKESPLAKEMREYGLTPTDNEDLNIALLRRAQQLKSAESEESKEIPYSQRPWADIMYQLNIQFNPDPKDDIQDIKDELALLMKGVEDDELNKEITDLESYVENLYISFEQNYSSKFDNSAMLNAQLNNLSMLNQVNLL